MIESYHFYIACN